MINIIYYNINNYTVPVIYLVDNLEDPAISMFINTSISQTNCMLLYHDNAVHKSIIDFIESELPHDIEFYELVDWNKIRSSIIEEYMEDKLHHLSYNQRMKYETMMSDIS